MKNKIISDEWDFIDNAINSLPAKTQLKEETKEANHPFSKFCTKDECATIITDNNGNVMKLVKIDGKTYKVEEKIELKDGCYVHTFSCRQKYILTKLTSTPNAVAMNYAFFTKFSDNDKFIVEIIKNKGKDVLERYEIDKVTVLKEGKIKHFPGYEKQIAVSLVHWKKI